MRALVVIAHYGEKNLQYLKEIIGTYRSMAMDVDLVVTAEASKELGAGVEVIVGLPESNPWSLPFAHKRVFADRVDQYDLFLYTEDDIGVTEDNIQAFLRASADLKPDELAGHVRYELGQDGTVYLPDVHGAFHWKPDSVRRRGSYMVAEYTNEHTGFYILTQAQLRTALASGGYLRGADEGRYGMAETAATDPFTRCGFRKVIPISAFDEFLVHHMPNTYVGRMGIPLTMFEEQIATLTEIHSGAHPAIELCEVEPKVLQRRWSKSYYEAPEPELLRLVPKDATTVLSIGCGWGATEVALKQHGAQVTALPLDSVIGASVARQGIEVVSGTLAECAQSLEGQTFDCVLMPNLLHLLPTPWPSLQQYSAFAKSGGVFIVSGFNFDFLPTMFKRRLDIGDYRKLHDFNESGVHIDGVPRVKRELRQAGFRIESVRWYDPPDHRQLRYLPGRWSKRRWILAARR
jgi:SAM-dependent methyltransferase